MCSPSQFTTLSAFSLYLVRSTWALICPIPSSSGVTIRNKTCPDFKADPTFIYCCTSKLPPATGIYKEKHSIYCCSLADFEKERQELATAELHNFIKQYLAVIIIGTLIAFGLTLTVTSLVCKRIRKCPLYQDRSMLSHSVQAATMYRPVDTIPPKGYEAPPPYECCAAPPPDQDGHEWNRILENEENVSRNLVPLP
uniref:Protein shisa-9 n=1 Tax=Haemonchus contortus TaxID=6289 RepID=A0A7I4YKC1_HAECO